MPRRWRPLYVVVTISYFLSPLLYDANFTSAGHATALMLGFGLALLAARVAAAVRRSEPGRAG